MAYTVIDYPTKKAFKEAFAKEGKLEAYQPGGMFPLSQGTNTIEGPHYPKPHKWYARVVIANNYVVQILG